ncbi:MAG: hypothetical protein NTY65_02365, partial [Planctomycetota bacterium]|nr:hypothetical protein [Planctomycetota bacterium]
TSPAQWEVGMNRLTIGLAAVLVALAVGASAQGAIIDTVIFPYTPPLQVGGNILTRGADFVTLNKTFSDSIGNAVDLYVTVDAPGDYWIEMQPYGDPNGGVFNYTTDAWNGFRSDLFPFYALDETPWDKFVFAPGSASSSAFPTVALTDSHIEWSGGIIPQGTDFHAVYAVHANAAGTFMIRESYTIPDPATLSLLALGGLMALRRRARR